MNKTIERRIGSNVRILRENAGFTQDLLAAKLQLRGCDITRSAVAKIEVGQVRGDGQRHLYPDELILIKEILNVTFDKLLEY